MFMSSYFLRSVFAGLTSCLFLVLFSGCGTEKSSNRESPSTWEASTWQIDANDGGQSDSDGNTTLISDRFTFSGSNSGRFSRTISTPTIIPQEPINGIPQPPIVIPNTGNYTYSKTGHNSGTLLLVFDAPNQFSLSMNLIFDNQTGGTGSAIAPGSNFGDRIYQIRFRRI